jgi:hypothetical protein
VILARRVVFGVMLVCVAAAVVMAGFKGAEQEPDTVYRLRYTSVVTAPGAEDLLDVERARRIIGDRPVVVVAGPVGVTCGDIAKALPELIVLVVSANLPFTDCGGRASHYDLDLLRETQDSVTHLDVGRDQTTYVAEYVRAFDANVVPGTPPPRRGPPQPGPSGGPAQLVVAVVIATVVLLGGGYLAHQVWSADRKAGLSHRSWRVRTNARLNQLADRIMRVDDPGRTSAERAATAKGYVLVLRNFESATTEEQRTAVDWQLRTLEEKAGIPVRGPRARVDPVKMDKARRQAEERRRAVGRRQIESRSMEERLATAKRQREAEQEAARQQEAERQVVDAQRGEQRRRAAKERRRRRNRRRRKR